MGSSRRRLYSMIGGLMSGEVLYSKSGLDLTNGSPYKLTFTRNVDYSNEVLVMFITASKVSTSYSSNPKPMSSYSSLVILNDMTENDTGTVVEGTSGHYTLDYKDDKYQYYIIDRSGDDSIYFNNYSENVDDDSSSLNISWSFLILSFPKT